jgi:uncharacterized protein (TIGR02001 family)
MKQTLISLAVLGAVAAPTAAVRAEEPAWTFPGSVTVVSDYLFRGQTQTWGEMATQVMLEANHQSGFYVGFFGSNVSDQWLPGATLETDLYGGYRGTLPGAASAIAIDVGVVYYMYPGADWDESGFNPPLYDPGTTESSKLDTGEFFVALTWEWLTLKAGIAFTDYFGWNTNNSGVGIGFAGDLEAGVTGDTEGSYFYELNAAYEVAPGWTLSAQVGEQVIEESTGLDIVYYKAGVTKALPHDFAFGVFYSGTDEPDAYKDFLSLRNTISDTDVAQSTVFASLSKAF